MLDTALVVDLGREALWVAVLIASPMLGIALLVGLIIGIVQAATSINEMTLSFIPKIAALEIIMGHALESKTPYTTNNKQATELTILSARRCDIAKEISSTTVAA